MVRPVGNMFGELHQCMGAEMDMSIDRLPCWWAQNWLHDFGQFFERFSELFGTHTTAVCIALLPLPKRPLLLHI